MTPQQILEQHPLRHAQVGAARVSYRDAGTGPAVTHVLLHGIGSASGSWALQLHAAQHRAGRRVLAWDAPGYGDSTALSGAAPDAGAYAQRLWDWLDALGATAPLTLVGHSLGAVIAARAARLQPARVRRLVLLSPARGYGSAPEAERRRKLDERLTLLAQMGPQGLARERAGAMLSPGAAPDLVDAVRATMARIDPAGYTQAARLLDQADLLADLAHVTAPVDVASGSADAITPPAACQAVARHLGRPWHDLGPVGHACPLEAGAAVAALIGLGPEVQEFHR
jgi:pimeloyl-ACP methyl ester carboxylesterase